jgi:hypothetical protein
MRFFSLGRRMTVPAKSVRWSVSSISSFFANFRLCTYDLTKFGGEIVIDVMRTHPEIIIDGILQKNSFFIPPDEFLRELGSVRFHTKICTSRNI